MSLTPRRVRATLPLWRAMALLITLAVALGAATGLTLYHFSPTGVGRTLAALARPTPSATPTPITQTPAEQTAALFQQINQSLTSYQDQPIDAHSGLRLIISKIHVNSPIVERGLVQGWMVVAPGNNVTHFTYSAYPGAIGNAILYSHADTVFRHLDSLAVGDIIVVQTPNGAIQFRVRELRIVSPTSLSVLDATQTPVLTLLTCYPFGVDSSRLAVIADPASS